MISNYTKNQKRNQGFEKRNVYLINSINRTLTLHAIRATQTHPFTEQSSIDLVIAGDDNRETDKEIINRLE